MKKNSELTYKEMYRQPASFQAVNDTLEDIFKTLDKVFFSEKKYDELIFTGWRGIAPSSARALPRARRPHRRPPEKIRKRPRLKKRMLA